MKGIVLLLVIFGIISVSMSAVVAAEDRQPVYRWFNPDAENNAYDHLYTINPDEDPTEAGYTFEKIAFYTATYQFHPDAVKLLRLWSEAITDHLYTIDQEEADNANNNLGYVYEEDLGWVLPEGVEFEDTIALVRFITKSELPNHAAHFYTVRPEDEEILDDYEPEGVACLVFADPGYPGLTQTAVYRWFNPDAENNAYDFLYTIDPSEDPTEAGYTMEKIAFYTGENQFHASAVKFLRLWNEAVTDHLYTIDQEEADNAIDNLGYVLEGDLGWVLPEDVYYENAIPLVRFITKPELPNHYAHFYTVRPEDEVILDDYDSEGVACQVFVLN